MFCSQCGAAVALGAWFCEECGAALGGAAVTLVPGPARGTKRRVWLWLVAGGGTALLVAAGIFAFRWFFDPEARANRLFVEASRLFELAKEAEGESYIEALKLYRGALSRLEKVTTFYPSTKLAVELMQGEARVGPYTIEDLKERAIPEVEPKAEAEENPLACTLLVARAIKDTFTQTARLTNVAGTYAQIGQYDQALQIAKTIEGAEHNEAWALAEIAGAYAKAGQEVDDSARKILHEIIREVGRGKDRQALGAPACFVKNVELS